MVQFRHSKLTLNTFGYIIDVHVCHLTFIFLSISLAFKCFGLNVPGIGTHLKVLRMYEIYKFLFYTPMVSHLVIWGSLKTECWGMGVIDAVRFEGIGQILSWLYFVDKILQRYTMFDYKWKKYYILNSWTRITISKTNR